ncbi:MAG: ABC-F family ATP-binding cassette domain-containing protein [Gemmatimonadetes bacterium]|nr:ABC-F family ATP-binding cassette domain-containing protein [Gemmatimonadota bacterium]
MGLIRVQNVSKQFGGQLVLEDVSLELHTGRIVGLIGANGAGKTTLFKLIAGLIEPDRGTITGSKGLDIGYLPQEPQVNPQNTLHDEVASAFEHLLAMEEKLHTLAEQMAEQHDEPQLEELMRQYDRVKARFDAAGGYTFAQKLNEVLGGLGFTQTDHHLPISALSGGQKCRAALARLLLQDRRFLLLDEPTNHLDLEAVRWLEKFLAAHHGGVVIISHDRFLLDRLADSIVEIENRRVSTYPGNYTNYAKTKRVRILTQQRSYEKDQAFIEKERAFITKHLAGQRTKEAQGRRTRLERRIKAGEFVLENPRTERSMKIEFHKSVAKGSEVLRTEELAKRYDDKALFADLSFQVYARQRFGITGPNGTGKTTLLKIILGEVLADHGRIEIAPKTTIGYYAQEATDLDPDKTVVDEIRTVRPDFSEHDARTFLARFLFTGDDVFKRISQLSGGEQSRARLAKLLLASPSLLILDEPTNHLDIRSREALEEALANYGGTIIAVSHDRYFLDSIVDHLLIMRPTGCTQYRGNYSFYIDQLEQEQERARQQSALAESKARPRKTPDAASPQKRTQPSPYDRLSIEELELLIIEKEDQRTDLNARFADPALYQDAQAVTQLRQRIETVTQDLTAIEQAWNERAENA